MTENEIKCCITTEEYGILKKMLEKAEKPEEIPEEKENDAE